MTADQIAQAAKNAIRLARLAHGGGWTRVSADHRYGAIARIVVAEFVAHAPDASVRDMHMVLGSDHVVSEVLCP